MVKSMTGFGRAQRTVADWEVTVEVKSVNHRYLESTIRLPRAYNYLEERLKAMVQQAASRGKVELSATVKRVGGPTPQVRTDRQLAQTYIQSLRELGEELDLSDDLTIASLLRLPDLFQVEESKEDEEEVWQAVAPVVEDALARFVAMRETEGERLREDILARLTVIRGKVALVEEQSPHTVEEYHARLEAKVREVLEDRQVDESRLLTEVALFADRVAVDEETVRLRSHADQVEETLAQGEPVGRRLDFLLQELNREANTIGSKAQDVAVARVVVDLKAELEKIREQVQNLE